jgi:hypothetical protein
MLVAAAIRLDVGLLALAERTPADDERQQPLLNSLWSLP